MANEHSIFISYRTADGSNLATWIYQNLAGHSIHLASQECITLTFQIDRGIPGGLDWKKYLDDELSKAAALIVVCSPSGRHKYIDRKDYYYQEIEWWITNRLSQPPILVSSHTDGLLHVPRIIQETWENLQVARIESHFLDDPESFESKRYLSIFMEGLGRGISDPLRNKQQSLPSTSSHAPICNTEGTFAWQKDRHGKYLYATEDYARAANADSPSAMYGKTDDVMHWWSLADLFRKGDQQIMSGNELSRLGVFEKELMPDRLADILVSEGVLRDHSNRIIGVQGSFLDVSKGISTLLKRKLQVTADGICLGAAFGHQYLDNMETAVLVRLLQIMPKSKIARSLHRKAADIDAIIRSLQIKLQCSSQDQILVTAIRAGIPLDFLLTTHFNNHNNQSTQT